MEPVTEWIAEGTHDESFGSSPLAFGVPAHAVGAALGFALKPTPSVVDREAVRFTLTGDSLHSLATRCCGPTMALSADGTLPTARPHPYQA